MTAADLHKLVQGIEECVPECLVYKDRFSYMPAGAYWVIQYDRGGLVIDPVHASDLIAGQVRRILPEVYTFKDDTTDWEVCVDCGHISRFAPTELEALLAAYRAWKGKEKAE